MDAATAFTGSGPAFIWLIAEAFHAEAVRLGFSHETARRMTVALFDGASAVLTAHLPEEANGDRPLHFGEFRDGVTSPTGTTAEGLYVLERGGIRTVIADGIHAAYDRCLQLFS